MQIKFDEVEYYGQVLHISKTCQDCKNECKIKSVCESIEIVCKRYKGYKRKLTNIFIMV